MNKSLLMAALTAQMLSASVSLGSRFRTDFADSNLLGNNYIGDDNDTSDGAGGTAVNTTEANANSNVITSVAGGGEQMQAQADRETSEQVGGQTLAAKKDDIDDASALGGTGQVKAIGDPPAGTETQQV